MKKYLLSIFFLLFSFFFSYGSFAQGTGNGNGGNKYEITGNQQPCVGATEIYTISPNPGNNKIEWVFDGPRAQANEVAWELLSLSADKTKATFKVGDKPGTIRAKPDPGTNNTENLAVHPGKGLDIALEGPNSLCANESQVYRVVIKNLNRGKKDNKDLNPEDLKVTWTLPSGLTITSGQNTSTLTVKASEAFSGGNVQVAVEVPYEPSTGPSNNGKGIGRITGFCGGEAKASMTVGVGTNCPPTAECPMPQVSISGSATVCPSQTQAVTFTAVVPNATAGTTYKWQVPSGWFLSAGQGTNTIEVLVGNTSGQISVIVTNNCQKMASAVRTILFSKNCGGTPPVCSTPQVNISGPATVCPSQSQPVTFTVGVANATADMNYNWSVPTGWFIKAGQGTSSIEVLVGNTAGQVGLTVSNNCGNNASDVHTVAFRENCGTTLPDCLIPQVSISGPIEVCAFGDDPVVFTANVENGSDDQEFIWSVPEDWFIISGENTNTIEVFVGFESGTVGVTYRNNVCGKTASFNKGVLTLEDCSALEPLPVELLSFAGESTKNGVLLQWATALEKDNDRFEVERSTDGQTFTKVGQVKGYGNSTTKRIYSMRDNRAGKGTLYYRLKQVDFNGDFEYSKIIPVNHTYGALVTQMVIAPNPVNNGQFNLSLPQIATDAQVQILDLNGKVLYTQRLEAGSTEATFSTQAMNMRPGIYLIKLQDGDQINQSRLIIK